MQNNNKPIFDKITFNEVSKSFNGIDVLKNVNLKIVSGETHIILGMSGCGKSVLMKSLLGLIKIDSGDIIVDGLSVKDKQNRDDYIRKFSILFQGGALFDSMTILENVSFGIKQLNKTNKESIAIAQEKLIAVGLSKDTFNLYPSELSGGMQKRAALARAIAIEPEILLFDEPTTGLDPISAGVICNLLKDTIQKLKITSIIITHDIKVAEFLGNKVSVIHNGNIVWSDNIQNIQKCGVEFVEDFYVASNIISRK